MGMLDGRKDVSCCTFYSHDGMFSGKVERIKANPSEFGACGHFLPTFLHFGKNVIPFCPLNFFLCYPFFSILNNMPLP
jgi:hypothetical protein